MIHIDVRQLCFCFFDHVLREAPWHAFSLPTLLWCFTLVRLSTVRFVSYVAVCVIVCSPRGMEINGIVNAHFNTTNLFILDLKYQNQQYPYITTVSNPKPSTHTQSYQVSITKLSLYGMATHVKHNSCTTLVR